MQEEVLKSCTPVAKKEHKCMYCNGVIPIGEKYCRDTIKYERTIYDWVAHADCCSVAVKLDMFSNDDDGLDDCGFQENIDEYLFSHYVPEGREYLPEHIDAMSRIEQVRMILADWDKPEFKRRRIKRDLAELDSYEKLTPWGEKRRKELVDELDALNIQLSKSH